MKRIDDELRESFTNLKEKVETLTKLLNKKNYPKYTREYVTNEARKRCLVSVLRKNFGHSKHDNVNDYLSYLHDYNKRSIDIMLKDDDVHIMECILVDIMHINEACRDYDQLIKDYA